MQTLEGGPAIVHAGPFGNIAHGCNSIIATRLGLALADIVVTEAGFGSDLGAEKFFDIKCRFGGLNPEAAVLVATVRALKLHGGADEGAARHRGPRRARARPAEPRAHIDNLKQYGVPVIVSVNRFTSDSEKELAMVADFARKRACAWR